MPDTVTALALAALAVLPGALYTWSFEQQAGRWGANASDRLQRFGGASAIFLALQLPLVYQCYRAFVVTHRIADGRPLPAPAWLLPPLLVAVPIAAGRLAGRATYERKPWVRLLTGPAPAPRAWDQLFAQAELAGWLILRLKDGSWMGGLWGLSEATGLRSYAAGYPEAQDLLLAELIELDREGKLVLGADGQPVRVGVSALVRWDEVTYAEFIPG